MMTTIDLDPGAHVVICLERSGSMQIPDCDGLSRWQYARMLIAEALAQLQVDGHPVTLLTFGRTIHTIPNAKVSDLEDLAHGDSGCCTGQAAGEALYHTIFGDIPRTIGQVPGAVVIITDGPPNQDTPIGHLLLSDPQLMAFLFHRTFLLTVGQELSHEFHEWLTHWPHHARLEDLELSTLRDREVPLGVGVGVQGPSAAEIELGVAGPKPDYDRGPSTAVTPDVAAVAPPEAQSVMKVAFPIAPVKASARRSNR